LAFGIQTRDLTFQDRNQPGDKGEAPPLKKFPPPDDFRSLAFKIVIKKEKY